MNLNIQEIEGNITLIELNGGLDSASLRELHDSVDKLLDAGQLRIILNCANLSYVSSAGIGALVTLHRRVKDAGGEIRIAGTTGAVFEVLELMNLGSILNLSADVEHARQALRTTQDGTPG